MLHFSPLLNPSVTVPTVSVVLSPSVSVCLSVCLSVCPFLCHSTLTHRAHFWCFGLVSLVSTKKQSDNPRFIQACSSAVTGLACSFAAPPHCSFSVLSLNAPFVFHSFTKLWVEEAKPDSPAIQNGGEEEKQTTEELEKQMKALSTNDTSSTPAAPPAKPLGGTPEGSPSKSPSKKKKKFKPPSFLKKSKKQKEKAETWGTQTRQTSVKYYCETFFGVWRSSRWVNHIRSIQTLQLRCHSQTCFTKMTLKHFTVSLVLADYIYVMIYLKLIKKHG